MTISYPPKRALNAGSTFPPLARRTARTTAASIAGKASFKVFSACCMGFAGRGGFGGATSSSEPGVGRADGVSFLGVAARGWGEAWVSCGSSSKSSSRAVVGDSGGFCVSSQSGFERGQRHCPQLTGFSGSDMMVTDWIGDDYTRYWSFDRSDTLEY